MESIIHGLVSSVSLVFIRVVVLVLLEVMFYWNKYIL